MKRRNNYLHFERNKVDRSTAPTAPSKYVRQERPDQPARYAIPVDSFSGSIQFVEDFAEFYFEHSLNDR